MLGYQGNPSSLKTQLHLHDQSWTLYYHYACLIYTPVTSRTLPHFLKNKGHCLHCMKTHSSMDICLNVTHSWWTFLWLSIHSPYSGFPLESKSALVFNTPGTWVGRRCLLLHIIRQKESLCNVTKQVHPWQFIYTTTVAFCPDRDMTIFQEQQEIETKVPLGNRAMCRKIFFMQPLDRKPWKETVHFKVQIFNIQSGRRHTLDTIDDENQARQAA